MEIIIEAKKSQGQDKVEKARKIKGNFRIGGTKVDIMKVYGALKSQLDNFNGFGPTDIGWVEVVDAPEPVGTVEDW